jgi:hypothetical protein
MTTMRKLHRHVPVAGALILAFLSGSCGFLTKTRVIYRKGKPTSSAQPLLTATRDELTARIANIYNAINSFQAKVDMTASEGSVYKGKITEIKDVLAYVLFRKPAEIRIKGLLPVVRSTAFDMVSNGADFSFYLTTSNLFVQGANNAPAVSKNKLENLRPDAFFSSMLIRPADDTIEAPIIEDQTDEDSALYQLQFVRRAPDGHLLQCFARSVWFDRLDLTIVRQLVYDDCGNSIVSDTRYSKWQPYGGVQFPAHIDLNRPKDGYGVVMDLMEMKMNIAMTDEQFSLPQPKGSKLQVIGASGAGGTH